MGGGETPQTVEPEPEAPRSERWRSPKDEEDGYAAAPVGAKEWAAFYEADSSSPPAASRRSGNDEAADYDNLSNTGPATGGGLPPRPGFPARRGNGEYVRREEQRPRGEPWAHDDKVSHCIGRLLRYHTASNQLTEDDDGFVSVGTMLQLRDFEGVDEECVRRIVQTSIATRGPRFELRERDTDEGTVALEIRALYRHPQDRPPRRDRCADDRRGGNDSTGARRHASSYGNRGHRGRSGFSQVPFDDAGAADEDSAARGGGEEADDMDWKMRCGDDRVLRAADAGGCNAVSSGAAAPGDGSIASTPQIGNAGGTKGSASTTRAVAAGEEVWEKFNEPATDRVWFWREATDEVFWADDPDCGWEEFEDAAGNPWWLHEASGRFFFEAD